MNKKKFTYKKSGVNIDAADKFVDFISTVSAKKRGKKKFSNIGGFGSITNIPDNIKQPRIVACTDGVGTILVPTPSVQATILGCLILAGIFVIEPNPPILENFFLPLFFAETVEMKLTNLSAALILTPLFL